MTNPEIRYVDRHRAVQILREIASMYNADFDPDAMKVRTRSGGPMLIVVYSEGAQTIKVTADPKIADAIAKRFGGS